MSVGLPSVIYPENGLTSRQVNRNKQSVGLSFAHPSGVSILHTLVKNSDVLVENFLPDTLKKYSMDYETVKKLNPGLVYASITGYGQTGPYRFRAGYDVMVEAEMGLMHVTGTRNGPPVKVGVAVTDLTTGLYASNSIMAALISRATTGKGQHIDIALSDCQVATLTNLASSALVSGEPDSGRWGTAHRMLLQFFLLYPLRKTQSISLAVFSSPKNLTNPSVHCALFELQNPQRRHSSRRWERSPILLALCEAR